MKRSSLGFFLKEWQIPLPAVDDAFVCAETISALADVRLPPVSTGGNNRKKSLVLAGFSRASRSCNGQILRDRIGKPAKAGWYGGEKSTRTPADAGV